MNDKFKGGNWRVSVVGLEYIFQILCLIAEIMIYRLPSRDSVESGRKNNFKERLREIKYD